MRLRIDHTTTYTYDEPAAYALHQVRKRPHDTSAQTVMSWDLVLDGAKDEARYLDQHGNHVDLISIEPGATKVSVTCRGEVETRDTSGVTRSDRPVPPLWLYQRFTPLTEAGKGVKALVAELGKSPVLDLDTLHGLMTLVADTVAYDTSHTGPTTTAEEALALGHGVVVQLGRRGERDACATGSKLGGEHGEVGGRRMVDTAAVIGELFTNGQSGESSRARDHTSGQFGAGQGWKRGGGRRGRGCSASAAGEGEQHRSAGEHAHRARVA